VSELLEKLKVVKDPQMPDLLGVSDRTWERMKERGDHPPKIQISERRIGYRVGDIGEWLDAKRRVAGNWQSLGDAAARVVDGTKPKGGVS
jgi:predicted DNA-binding transcriptional regulator AlpA